MKRPVVLIVLMLLLWSCGGDDDGDNASGTDATSQSNELQEKLLTLSDLPEGYTLSEADQDDTVSEFCEGKFDIENKFPPEQKAEVEFQKSGAEAVSGSLVAEFLAEYSTDDAEQAFNAAEAAVEECKTFQQTDEADGTTLSGTIEPMSSFPGLGNETLAMKVTGNVTVQDTTVPVAIEVVFVREEGTIIGVANAGLGASPVDSQLTEKLTEVAYQKAF